MKTTLVALLIGLAVALAAAPAIARYCTQSCYCLYSDYRTGQCLSWSCTTTCY